MYEPNSELIKSLESTPTAKSSIWPPPIFQPGENLMRDLIDDLDRRFLFLKESDQFVVNADHLGRSFAAIVERKISF